MGKAVRGRDHARSAVLAAHVGGHGRSEVALQGRNAARRGNLAHVGRLDAEHAVTAGLEVGEERAVVRADIDDEVGRRERQQRRGFGIKLGEVVAQELGGAAGVGIFGGKDDDGVYCKPELDKLAAGAVQELGGKPGLLARRRADRDHLVDGRHVAQREDAGERRMSADLTAFDRDAGSGPRGSRNFCRKQTYSLQFRAMALLSPSSCAGLSRASTSVYPVQDVDGRAKPGHDD